MPKASRDTEKKVFISKKHPQDLLGNDSPGPLYIPKRQRNLPSWGFGTAPARPPPAGQKYPESSNNLIGTMPDGQVFKYGSKSATIGTCPRFGAGYNQPDYDGFPPGEISPGPQRYNCYPVPMPKKHEKDKPWPKPDCTYCHRMSHAPSVDHIPPRYTMREKTKIKELESQTGPKIGPGSYPAAEACSPQARSEKPSKPQWSFSKNPRFPQPSLLDSAGRLWDGTGERKIQFNRAYSSPASYSFGTSTRQHRKKVAPCILPKDLGPANEMGDCHQDHPPLPPRKEVLKFTDVPAGRN